MTYVSNIYKYYIAYKLTVEQNQEKQAAMAAAGQMRQSAMSTQPT